MSSVLDDPVGEVRRRADIVEVVSETVVLKRSGRNYMGLCPFHGERSPSFNVNPERQIFRCFGCGEGGDIFTFVMKSQHLTFPEALKLLAERYGVPLPERRPDEDDRTAVRQANETAASFYRWMLQHEEWGAKARSYLENRGVSAEIQERFGLGYAPAHWDSLHRHLAQAKVPVAIQEKAALVRPRSSGGGYYDYFRNRLMFPIHNEAGQVVGFGARAIDPADEPKYLNSPETVLYRKGNLLYGLNQARDAIRRADEALLMEGYMDVITAHAQGFTQAVGVLGTALTPSQARVLLRYTPGRRVTLAFDADRAGQQAAERGLATLAEVTQGVGLTARVLAVPEGKDPDEFLRKQGPEAFRALLDAAPNLTEFLVGRAIAAQDVRTPEGRAHAVTAAVAELRKLENAVERDHYIRELAERLGVREEAIRFELRKGLGLSGTPMGRGAPLAVKKLSTTEAERILLYFMVEQPSVRQLVHEQLASIVFEPAHEAIRARIDALVAAHGVLTWQDLLDAFAGDEVQKVVSAIMFAEYERWAEEFSKVAEDACDTVRFAYWQGELKGLQERLKREAAELDDETHRAIAQRLRELNEYCVQLKHKRSNIISSN